MNMFDNIHDILRLFAHVGSFRRAIIVGLVMANALNSPLMAAEQSSTATGEQGNLKGNALNTPFPSEANVNHPPNNAAIRPLTGSTLQIRDLNPADPWIRTAQPMTLLSVNDGQAHLKFDSSYLKAHTPLSFERTNFTRDSFTVVQLGPDHPPIVKTVYDTVPNTIMGPAYLATCCDGRYAFVTCHNDGAFGPEHGNILSVIDLGSPNLAVAQKLNIPAPTQAITHPDGKHLIVSCATGFQVFEIKNGLLVLAKNNLVNGFPISMDLSPSGDRIVAALWKAYGDPESAGVHIFSYRNGTIEHQREVKIQTGLSGFNKPFALQFSPDGKRVLSLNGEGQGTKGSLDDVLSIDMTLDPPTVTEVISQVADGIESVAFHPKGEFAVLSCLEEDPMMAQDTYSHLAVLDMRSKPVRILYYVPVEAYPEGVAFTPDGSKLFVQVTTANHITVFDVDGLLLKRSPFVIRVGHGPSSMALFPRFMTNTTSSDNTK